MDVGMALVIALAAAGFRLGTSIPGASAIEPPIYALMGGVLGFLLSVGLVGDPAG